jgi:Undecaprenyl-phosphate glucose phosphotransferase
VLKERGQLVAGLLFALDVAVLSGAWLAAFSLRFSGWPVEVYHGVPSIQDYLVSLLFIPPIWLVFFRYMDLHRPRIIGERFRECVDIVKASTLCAVCLLSAGRLFMKLDLSRVLLVYFWVFSTFGILALRMVFRQVLMRRRLRGSNLRRALIVGTEKLAQHLKSRIDKHVEMGLDIKGYLTRHADEVGQLRNGAEIIGCVDDLPALLDSGQFDLVLVALPSEAQPEMDRLLSEVDKGLADIKVIPDLYKHSLLSGSVEEFEGMPVVSLVGSPLFGWGSLLKRGFDLAAGAVLLVLFAPLLTVIAVAVKLTSSGPVFYRQERMGLDGRTFEMLKFRTMRADAEERTGPVWARQDDPRRTRLGAFLRRSSFDELPQLWQVVKGEMSLVGPRPERPVFIEEFRQKVPSYMVRHRVKTGITGWAQVNGWRGNTSIHKRIKHDLYYIQNWSFGFDLRILWRTLWHGFFNRNAY